MSYYFGNKDKWKGYAKKAKENGNRKKAMKKFNDSEKGKFLRAKYQKTEKGKTAQKKWDSSEKGKLSRRKRDLLSKVQRKKRGLFYFHPISFSLNVPFDWHHVNVFDVVSIPRWVHRAVPHVCGDGKLEGVIG